MSHSLARPLALLGHLALWMVPTLDAEVEERQDDVDDFTAYRVLPVGLSVRLR